MNLLNATINNSILSNTYLFKSELSPVNNLYFPEIVYYNYFPKLQETINNNPKILDSMNIIKDFDKIDPSYLTLIFGGFFVFVTTLATLFSVIDFSFINSFIPIHLPETLNIYTQVKTDLYSTAFKTYLDHSIIPFKKVSPYQNYLLWIKTHHKILPQFLPIANIQDYVVYIYLKIKLHNNDPVFILSMLQETKDPIRIHTIKLISEYYSTINSNYTEKMSILGGLMDALKKLNPSRLHLSYTWVFTWTDANTIIRDPGLHPDMLESYAYSDLNSIFQATERIERDRFLNEPHSIYRIREQMKDPKEMAKLYRYIYYGIIP